jgi:hypothetical protein
MTVYLEPGENWALITSTLNLADKRPGYTNITRLGALNYTYDKGNNYNWLTWSPRDYQSPLVMYYLDNSYLGFWVSANQDRTRFYPNFLQDVSAWKTGGTIEGTAWLDTEPTVTTLDNIKRINPLQDATLSPGGNTTVVTDQNGTIVNSTCITQALLIPDYNEMMEAIEACIDAELNGTDPDNPNPPGTDYPQDGKGVLTRFNMKFWIWLIGWVCIIAPCLRIASGGLPIEYYYGYAIMILTGFALIWSVAGI